jgi:hypothetical protein
MTAPSPDSDIQIEEILEDFAEGLADAKEEDSFAKINEVVTDSVNEAKARINALITSKQKEVLEQISVIYGDGGEPPIVYVGTQRLEARLNELTQGEKK